MREVHVVIFNIIYAYFTTEIILKQQDAHSSIKLLGLFK